jgi:hypothetical protein
MLYDPKWKDSTALTLASLIGWLERQAPEATYCYENNGHCLLGQYLTEQGYENVHVFTIGFVHGSNEWSRSDGLTDAIQANVLTYFPSVFDTVSCGRPRTFGAVLNRARELSTL